MPLITIHTSSEDQDNKLTPTLEELRKLSARELSCGERELDPNEFSVRVIRSNLNQSIADIEIVIIAHCYRERVEKQDQICMLLKEFIEKQCAPYTAFVWLQLSELGHSIESKNNSQNPV